MINLISVIVPIYNSEQYILDCVKSVLLQTYTSLELILVDDGSSDKSQEICKKICKKDKRVLFIQQDHRGVSAARNAGIKAAQGKYLFFMDSDDVIHPQLLEKLYRLQEETSSTIATEGRYYAKEKKFQKPQEWERDTKAEQIQESIYLDNEKAVKYLLDGNMEATLYVIGGKMIHRDMLKELRFDERLTQGEDTLFLYRLLEEGADVIVLYHNWYYYRIHEEGISNIFSIGSCRDKYIVERYISDQEIERGRIFNAIQKEEYIVLQLMVWYKESCQRGNSDLKEYVKRLAKDEKKQYLFSQICWINKVRFYTMFHCYLFYYISHWFLMHFPKYPQLQWEIKYKNMLKKEGAKKNGHSLSEK